MAGRSFAGLLGDAPAQPTGGTVDAQQLGLAELEQQHGLPPGLLSAVMDQESKGRVNAVSPAGAQGPFQFMPATARQYGINPFDPQQSAGAAAQMYGELSRKYGGDLPKMLAGYNWGQGNVDKLGLQNAPAETRDYIRKIMGKLQTGAIEPVQEAPARQALAGTPAGRSFAGLLADQQEAAAPAEEPGFWERTREIGRRIDAGLPLEPGGEAPAKLGNMGTYNSRLWRGLTDPIRGIKQGANLLIPDVIERALSVGGKTFNEQEAQQEAQFKAAMQQQGQTGFDWARLAGNMASPVNLALGAAKLPASMAAKLPQGAQWLARMAVPAAAQSAVQPVYDPSGKELTTAQLTTEKAKQVGLGAAAGVAGGALASGLTSVGGKIAGALKGQVDPRAQELLDLSKQFDIPLTASNIDEPRRSFVRRAQQLVERVPVGLDAQVQRGKAVASAQGYADRALQAMRSLPFTNLKDVQKVAEGTSKRAAAAKYVLGLVDEAGDDWKRIVRASGNLKALRMKLQSDRNYDELGRAMGNQKQVEPLSLMRSLVNLQRAESGQIRADRSLSNLLSRYQTQLDSEDFVPTWDSMRQLRTSLNQEVQSITKPGVKEPAGFVDAYKTMIAAITNDMDRFARNHPNSEVRTLWKNADKFYKAHVVPFEERDLASTLADVDTDHIWARFVANTDEAHQRRMWKALDERGRAAVRYGIIKEKVDEAFNESLGSIDPIKLSNSLQRLKTTTDIYFDPKAKTELAGFTKILGHLKHMTEPEGGQFGYNVGYGGALGALFGLTGAPGAAVGAGTAVGLKQLLTTERGLKILFAANLAKQGSPRMAQLADEAIKLATEATAEAAGSTAGRAPSIIERAQQAGSALGGQSAGRVVGGSPPAQNRRER